MEDATKRKIEDSVKLIQQYEQEADKYGGFHTAYSGGKDSEVLLWLMNLSGVKHMPFHNVTTIDPPENIRFIRKTHPEVQIITPPLNFFQLVEKQGYLPDMQHRFCCRKLKEDTFKGFVATGVRHDESQTRANYIPVCFNSKNTSEQKTYSPAKMRKNRKVHFRPMLQFQENEIWEIIEEQNLTLNPIYESYGRVGCMFCPYKNKKEMLYSAKSYPKYFKLLLRTISNIMQNKNYMSEFKNATPLSIFLWWISKQTAKQFFTQLSLFENDDNNSTLLQHTFI